MRRALSALLLSATLIGGLAACGSDDDSSTTTKAPAATTADGGDTETTTGDAGDTGSANAAVADYCKQADELAAELKKVMADPASGDMAAVSAKSQELITAAVALQSSNPDDLDEINACSAKLTAAVSGG